MANVQYTHDMGAVGYNPYAPEAEQTAGKSLKSYTNLLGAILSVSLVAGVGIWGYQLVMRDVSGIPVVRAAAGEMRVRPDDPGGQLALHQGLAVNEVAADGEASGPVDRLVLAPRPTALQAEDGPVSAAPVQQPQPLDVQVDDADLDDMVATLLERAKEMEDATVEASPLAEDVTAGVEADVEAAIISVAAAIPTPAVATPAVATPQFTSGVLTSARPQLRPIRAVARSAAPTATPAVAMDVDPGSLPVGTRLVQLGALDSPDTARAQWSTLSARFGDYMADKQMVIQEHATGGRKFFRLRAMGFDDLADARRFCAALIADGAECIPVVTR